MPEWTETPKKRGLDPLGMQNSGVLLYQNLLPGVSNVTLRMRYYGFYCWLIDLYARRHGSTAADDWRQWIRRGEALFALAAAKKGGDAALGVGGVEWALETLQTSDDPIDFGRAAGHEGRVYLAQALGVFGGAYASQMVEAGFFSQGDNHDLVVPSKILGADAALAFKQAVGENAAAIFSVALGAGVITRAALDELARFAPDAIAADSTESALYRDALFARRNDLTQSAPRRRDTLNLILRTAKELGRRPSVDDLRWTLFTPATDADPLSAQRLRWEAYQLQDLFQVAAAGLLRWALDLLRDRTDGAPLSELLDLCLDPLLPSLLGPTWRTHVLALRATAPDARDLSRRVTQVRGEQRMTSEQAIAALTLIGALDARVRERGDLEDEITRSFSFGDGFRSITSERAFLSAREDDPIALTLRRFFQDRILNRHARVALQKFRTQRDYTYLFEIEDGRFHWRASYAPVFTTPRLAPALTFLTDIGLLDAHGLTPAGHTLLEEAS